MIDIYSYLKKINLLKRKGLLLDLGSGQDNISAPFEENGYDVVAVDLNLAESEPRKHYKHIRSDISDFEIVNNKYDIIILRNVLPFLKSKKDITAILNRSVAGLKVGGIIYFTLFGLKDQWAKKKKKLVYFSDKQAQQLATSLNLEIILESSFYGLGKTKFEEIKYWHIFEFVFKNE